MGRFYLVARREEGAVEYVKINSHKRCTDRVAVKVLKGTKIPLGAGGFKDSLV